MRCSVRCYRSVIGNAARRRLHAQRTGHSFVSEVMVHHLGTVQSCEETTVWLIEISVAGRTITRRVAGKRRELLGFGGRPLPVRPTELRQPA